MWLVPVVGCGEHWISKWAWREGGVGQKGVRRDKQRCTGARSPGFSPVLLPWLLCVPGRRRSTSALFLETVNMSPPVELWFTVVGDLIPLTKENVTHPPRAPYLAPAP